jgi:hypothetical protein
MEKYTKLIDWIKNNGGYIDDTIYIEIIEDGNRTMKVSQNRSIGDILIKIPKKCTITTDETEEFHLKISHKLLQEFSKGDESFYKDYLNILPSLNQFSTHPFYKYTDMKKIENISNYVYNYLNRFHISVDYFYENYVKNDEHLPNEFKTIEWCKYVLILNSTRAWGTYGFVPVIDMIQHSFNLSDLNCVLENESGELIFLNRKDLNRMNELSLGYNTYPNLDLYLNYNIYNRTDIGYIPIHCTLDKNSEIYQFQKDCLKRYNFETINDKITLILMNDFNPMNVLISRIMQMTEIDLKLLSTLYNFEKSDDLNNLNFSNTVSMRNEYITIKYLINTINQLKIPIQNRDYEYETIINLIDTHNTILDKNINYLKQYWQSLLE